MSDGGWVVTWQSADEDGSNLGLYQQRNDANSDTVGPETQVNTYVTGSQSRATVTALSDGGWVVTWQSLSQGGTG